MSDLVTRFEDCTLPSDEFHHAEHVRVAWEYLRREPLMVDALHRFATGLRRFAGHHGQPSLYHETITWAFVVLINERLLRDPDADWSTFSERNADLLIWKPSILEQHYSPGRLSSEAARRAFVFPDRLHS